MSNLKRGIRLFVLLFLYSCGGIYIPGWDDEYIYTVELNGKMFSVDYCNASRRGGRYYIRNRYYTITASNRFICSRDKVERYNNE